MRKFLIKILNRMTGRKFWYSINFVYKDKSGKTIFDFTREVGFMYTSSVLIARESKLLFPLHRQKWIPKHLLSNGNLYCEIKCYVGWLKIPKP